MRGNRNLAPFLVREMQRHASSEAGEVCGFVYAHRYQPLRNVSGSNRAFDADPSQIAGALAKYGEPEAIFHTHPDGNLELSPVDRKLWYYTSSTMIVGCMRDGHLHWKMYGNRGD